jgi:ABC-type cobalamin/Fe3+-siderophores transport system ATPase subunit
MDVDQQLQCFALLAEEASAGRLCLAVTHDPNLAMRFCTRLIVLANAAVAFDGAPHRALETPAWMPALSSHLTVVTDRDRRPWIAYR